MISAATVPPGRLTPPHVAEVNAALTNLHGAIQNLWAGDGIDGRKVARLLDDHLPSWNLERIGSRQALTWDTAGIRPFLVDGERESGRSILEIEGGGALQPGFERSKSAGYSHRHDLRLRDPAKPRVPARVFRKRSTRPEAGRD